METIFNQMHIIGQEKMFLININQRLQVTTSDGTSCESEKLNPPLGPPPPQSSITSIASLLTMGKLGKNTTVLQGTKGCRLKHKVLATMDYSFDALNFLFSSPPFNVPKGSLYSFTRDSEGSNLCDLKAYGRPRVI